MRHSGRDGCQLGHPFGTPQLFLQTLPLGDVPRHHENRGALLIAVAGGGDLHIDGDAIELDEGLLKQRNLLLSFRDPTDALLNRRRSSGRMKSGSERPRPGSRESRRATSAPRRC